MNFQPPSVTLPPSVTEGGKTIDGSKTYDVSYYVHYLLQKRFTFDKF